MSAPTAETPAPTHPLLVLAVTHLAPLFLQAAGNDPTQARAAAHAAIAEFGARTGLDILLVAQIIAFSLAAIDTAVQSTSPDLPPETKSRLQTQANALSRTADRGRKTLAQWQHQAQRHARPQPAPPPQPTPNQAVDNRSHWAAAFAQVAQEVADSLPAQSPDQRRAATMQAAGLRHAARALQGATLPPATAAR